MLYQLIMVLSAVILIQACGSNTSVETVTGLSTPESVSVVPNKADVLRVSDFVYSKQKGRYLDQNSQRKWSVGRN